MWVQSLGQEDPREEGMATHFSILAWRIPWTDVPGGLQSMGLQRVGHNWATWHTCIQGQALPVLLHSEVKCLTYTVWYIVGVWRLSAGWMNAWVVVEKSCFFLLTLIRGIHVGLSNPALWAPYLLHVWSICGLCDWNGCMVGTWGKWLLSLPSQTSDSRSDSF